MILTAEAGEKLLFSFSVYSFLYTMVYFKMTPCLKLSGIGSHSNRTLVLLRTFTFGFVTDWAGSKR